MVGAGCGDAGGARRGSGCDGAERRPAHARQVTARVGIRFAVVSVRVLARAGRCDAPRRSAGRPLRPQEGHAGCAGALRAGLGGLRIRTLSWHVHRSPRAARPRRCRGGRDGARSTDRPLRRGGAAEGGRDLGSRELLRVADRADPRRLDPLSLLVGLGLPDQCPGRGCRGCRRARARAGRPSEAPAGGRPGRNRRLGRRPRRCDVRPHRGRPPQLDRRSRAGPDNRRDRAAPRLLRLGATTEPTAGRRAARRPGSVPLSLLHLERDPPVGGNPLPDRRLFHDAPVLPGCPRHGSDGLRASTAAPDRGPHRRRASRRPDRATHRRQAHRRHGLRPAGGGTAARNQNRTHLRQRLRRRVDGARRRRHGRHHGDDRIVGARRDPGGAQRSRLGRHAGAQQDRWAARRRHPRQRAHRHVPRASRPVRPAPARRRRSPREHLRGRRRRGSDALASTAPLCPRSVHARGRPRARHLRRHCVRRSCSRPPLPAAHKTARRHPPSGLGRTSLGVPAVPL
jgi:hypothetical protein